MNLTELRWLETYINEPIKEWETIDTGWDHEVYVVNGNWVLRIPKEERHVNCAEQKLLSELQLKADIRLPTYRICKAPDGKEVMLYRYISGHPIHRDIPADARKEAAVQLGSFLTELHHVDTSRYELPKRDKVYYELLFEKIRRYYPSMPASIIHHAEKLFTVLQTEPMAVVHGDLRTEHILWEKAIGKIGIIDFSDVHIGDPAIDFAGISQVGDGFMEQVLCHYDGDKHGISQRAGELSKLGLFYDLLHNGPSSALLEEMESKLK